MAGTNLTAYDGPYVNDAGVNTSANYVYANLTSFSIYGISGSAPSAPSAPAGGGGGGGAVAANTSDLAYFKETFRSNGLILVPDTNVTEDWEAAKLIQDWFKERYYDIELMFVSEYDNIRDEDKVKILIGGHMANSFSREIGIGEYFSRMADNKPWLLNGEANKGIVKLYDKDPFSIISKGKVLVIAGTDRKQTLRVAQDFLKEVEKQEGLSAKANIGTKLVL